MAGFGAVAGALTGGLTTLYDIWSNERDFNYQQSLQQDVFNREDNAVQRRMEDLQKAGLNPNLAAGSAAGAGSVVGRSTTPQVNFGAAVGQALDAENAVAQIQAQKTQNQILQNEKKQSDIATRLMRDDYATNTLQNAINQVSLLYQLGITDGVRIYGKQDGTFGISQNQHTFEPGKEYLMQDTPLMNQLLWQWQANKNAADMLQKDVDYYDADKIFGYVNSVGNLFGSGAGAFNSFSQGRKAMRYWR